MLTLTVLLLVIGAILAAAGTAGFLAVIHQPASSNELRCARKAATAGRWMLLPGLVLYGAHHGVPAGPGFYAITLASALTVATIVTKSNIRAAT